MSVSPIKLYFGEEIISLTSTLVSLRPGKTFSRKKYLYTDNARLHQNMKIQSRDMPDLLQVFFFWNKNNWREHSVDKMANRGPRRAGIERVCRDYEGLRMTIRHLLVRNMW